MMPGGGGQVVLAPEKNLDMNLCSKFSPQLNTMHCTPSALPSSLIVSVFPVPAGPGQKQQHSIH
jgi:hypothetical protein